jgi:hypothetical protein
MACECLEIGGLQLDRYGLRGQLGALQAPRDRLRQRPKFCQQSFLGGQILIEGRLGGDAFGRRIRIDFAIVLAARKAIEPAADRAEFCGESPFTKVLELPDRHDPARCKPPPHGFANPVNQSDRLRPQKIARFRSSDHGKPARLVEIGGNLGEELVAGEANGDGDADLIFNAPSEAYQCFRRWSAMHSPGPRQIQKSLVDRKRLDQGRRREHQLAHVFAGLAVLRHVWRDHHRIGTKLQRLEHRHCRTDAGETGDVAAGRDHPAMAAADDHRAIPQAWIVAFLDGGVERIAIDMRDRKEVQFGVLDAAPFAALDAAPPRRKRRRRAAAAATSAHCHNQAAPRTPLESPCRGGIIRVASRSEKTRGTRSGGTRS